MVYPDSRNGRGHLAVNLSKTILGSKHNIVSVVIYYFYICLNFVRSWRERESVCERERERERERGRESERVSE